MTLNRLLRLLLGIALLVVSVVVVVFTESEQQQRFLQQSLDLVSADSVWGPVIFVVLEALATALLIPASFFTLSGGALYGPLWGTLINVMGVSCGGLLGFLVARHIAGESLRKRIERGNSRRLEQTIQGVEREGWRFVAFTRLVPGFPFFLMNYLFGITRISARSFFVATVLAVTPGVFVFSYLGHVGRSLFADDQTDMLLLLGGVGLISLLVFVPRFVSSFRR